MELARPQHFEIMETRGRLFALFPGQAIAGGDWRPSGWQGTFRGLTNSEVVEHAGTITMGRVIPARNSSSHPKPTKTR